MPSEIPDYQPFYLESIEALRAECLRVGVDLPIEDETGGLAQPLVIGATTAPNRFCAQPIAGGDAGPDGSPGELTRRRYRRLAEGGFGLIWVESTFAGPDGEAGGLRLDAGNAGEFAALVEETRRAAREQWKRDVVLVLQLASGPPRVDPAPDTDEGQALTDGEIDQGRKDLVEAAHLAVGAGFDGVDIQACRGTLAGRLLGGMPRKGKYGGALENRARFLREAVEEIRTLEPECLLATRLCAYDAIRRPYGFGVDAADFRRADPDEPVRLVRALRTAGLDLLNVTVASPRLTAPVDSLERLRALRDSDPPDEPPLMVIERQLRAARTLREAVPGMPVVGSGLSWLRQFLPAVAAGCLRDGVFDFAGLGRAALACPDAPAQVTATGQLEPESCCMVCHACGILREEGGPVGCPIRDGEVYGPAYRQARRFSSGRLDWEARRCHQCEAAPCTAASRTGVDIPGFIKAFAVGDDIRAFEIIRTHDILPEMTSRLSPGWLHSEGACIESTLSGNPIPIQDLQFVVSWGARDRGETGVRLPSGSSGRRVAVVGGGPAGVAACARLLELGHSVDLLERAEVLGGVPERVIPGSRFPGAREEIDALLAPAVAAERLKVRCGTVLGEDVEFRSMLGEFNAVLLAAGLWREKSLGKVHGVVDALAFLESAKRGGTSSAPCRVAVLSGGDCAMDAGRVAEELGAEEVFVVFGAPRSEMHWHMPEDWFAKPGVHAMMSWQPLGYDVDSDGRLAGVKLRHAELGVESTLRVGLAIEAMGIEVTGSLLDAVPGLELNTHGLVRTTGGCLTSIPRVYAAGALVNGGASVARCVAEGMRAAERIHRDLVKSP